MRRIRVALVIAALFAGAAVSLHAEAIVPAGTPIVMTLDQSVSSKDARTGQKVDCTVAQNVVVGGKTVIPKGSKGTCSVASVQDRKSTRLNSSHRCSSYAVFCLKKNTT